MAPLVAPSPRPNLPYSDTGRRRHSQPFLFHQRHTDGYSVYVSFMPETGLAVIVLTNQHRSEGNMNGPPAAVAPPLVPVTAT